MIPLRDLVRVIERVVAPLRARIDMQVSRFVVDAVISSGKLQTLKGIGFADEVIDPIEHFEPGGLTHNPGQGAEGVLLSGGGYRDHPMAVGVSQRSARPVNLANGETALYTAGAQGGTRILLKTDGSVVITPSSKVRIEGDLEVTGEVKAMADGASVSLSTHQHPTAMGPSGPPTPGT